MKLTNSKNTIDYKLRTANDLTDVKDIKGGLLYTKSGYIIGFLRLLPVNIDLLSNKENESRNKIITGAFKEEKKGFSYLVIPRTVDMEIYLNDLSRRHDDEISSSTKKLLLSYMMNDASKKILDGQNFEHQFYIMVWEKYNSNVAGQENELKNRLRDFRNRYESVKNAILELNDTDILKLCNLYANSNTAVFDNLVNDEIFYTPLPALKGKG